MTYRLSRFLRLERARAGLGFPSKVPAVEKEEVQSRFLDLRGPASETGNGSEPEALGAPLERFGLSTPPPPSPLAELSLEPLKPSTQPFVRCPQCEVDNTLYVQRCFNCETALDTPQTRAFNEALWQRQREAADAERVMLLEGERRRQKDAAAEAEARRTWAVEAAREVKRQVEWELESESGAARAMFFRLLRRLFRSQR